MTDRRPSPAPVDAALLDFCQTDRQRSVVQAIISAGMQVAAARRLGISIKSVERVLQRVRRQAALAGHAPREGVNNPVPPGFEVKRLSQHYTGDVRDQHWVISEPEKKRLLDLLRDAVVEIAEPLRGTVKPTPPPKRLDRDLLVAYPIGDAHIGLYSWAAETGDDHNLEIAEADLTTAMRHLVLVAPAAEQGIVISVGDLLHADTSQNRTPQSGHQLDVDTRYAKVMAAALRTLRTMIDLGLRKHKRMHVILARGNHDPHASVMQALCLAALYEKEPRVTVDLSPAAFYWYRHGKCFIGVNHGDKVKPNDMPLIMATDRPHDWSKSVHRIVYGGHWHHDVVRDFRGCTVETIRTLAGPDNYSAEGGWRSQRDMKADVWHREDGRILRHTIGIRQVRSIQKRKAA